MGLQGPLPMLGSVAAHPPGPMTSLVAARAVVLGSSKLYPLPTPGLCPLPMIPHAHTPPQVLPTVPEEGESRAGG